jgi:hypothetical protein
MYHKSIAQRQLEKLLAAAMSILKQQNYQNQELQSQQTKLLVLVTSLILSFSFKARLATKTRRSVKDFLKPMRLN